MVLMLAKVPDGRKHAGPARLAVETKVIVSLSGKVRSVVPRQILNMYHKPTSAKAQPSPKDRITTT